MPLRRLRDAKIRECYSPPLKNLRSFALGLAMANPLAFQLVSAPDPFHTCAEKGVEYTRGKGLANRVGVARARVEMWEQLERNDC